MSSEIITYSVYANGIYWGDFEATCKEEAIQIAAMEHGTTYAGEDHPETTGMTAEEIE